MKIIDEIIELVASWEKYADQYGVNKKLKEAIGLTHLKKL